MDRPRTQLEVMIGARAVADAVGDFTMDVIHVLIALDVPGSMAGQILADSGFRAADAWSAWCARPDMAAPGEDTGFLLSPDVERVVAQATIIGRDEPDERHLLVAFLEERATDPLDAMLAAGGIAVAEALMRARALVRSGTGPTASGVSEQGRAARPAGAPRPGRRPPGDL